MDTKYNLSTIVNQIVTSVSGAKAQKETKFGLQYLITNVSEADLTALDFVYIGMDFANVHPMYRMANIECYFDEGILYIYEF